MKISIFHDYNFEPFLAQRISVELNYSFAIADYRSKKIELVWCQPVLSPRPHYILKHTFVGWSKVSASAAEAFQGAVLGVV